MKMIEQGPGFRVFNTAQAAKYLGYSVRTLEDWRMKRLGPHFMRINDHTKEAFYFPKDLLQFEMMHAGSMPKAHKFAGKKVSKIAGKKMSKRGKRAKRR